MKLLEMKTVTITEKGQISIPKNLRKLGGFAQNEKVVILAFDDHLELRPMKRINERLFTAMVSEPSLSKDWLSNEDEKAWRKLQKGT